MGTQVNKAAYEALIKEDMDAVVAEMSKSPERAHVIQILQWSVDALYPSTARFEQSSI